MRRAFDSFTDGQDQPAFLFNLPATWQSSTARMLYVAELERLGKFLVRLGGHSPSAAGLSKVMKDFDEQRGKVREVIRARPGRPAAEALAALFGGGALPQQEITAAKWYQNDVVGATRIWHCGGRESVPLALVGGPIVAAEWGLFDVLEAAGATVVLNGAEPGERCLLPPLPEFGGGQGSFDELVNHYFENIVDVFRRPNSQLYSWLARYLPERGCRGILVWVRVGCDLWRAEAASLRETFGLPVLVLDSTVAHGSADRGALGPRELTRIAAFLESL